MTEHQLTGRHVLAMFCRGFGIIIAVNVALAVSAVRTFPGLEVANSYVASQNFERRRQAQEALGWTLSTTATAGRVEVDLRDAAGAPAPVQDLAAVIGLPTGGDRRAADGRRPARLRWRPRSRPASGASTSPPMPRTARSSSSALTLRVPK